MFAPVCRDGSQNEYKARFIRANKGSLCVDSLVAYMNKRHRLRDGVAILFCNTERTRQMRAKKLTMRVDILYSIDKQFI